MRKRFNPDDERPLLPPNGVPPPTDAYPPLLCNRCFTLTDRKELSQYGARCLSCYEAYCREPQRAIDVGNKRLHGPRAWAHALKRREEAGERLTPPQRAMWRAALGYAPPLAGDEFEVDTSRERIASEQERVADYAKRRGISL